MHRRIPRFILSLSWFFLVSAIVISTLLVSLISLTSEDIDSLRPKILQWVETNSGQLIKAEKLELEWQGIIPHLKLSKVQLLDRNTQQEIFHFDQAKVNVDLYRSLLEWQLTIGKLELWGINLKLMHKRDGSIAVFGLAELPSNDGRLRRWMMQQSGLEIRDSKLIWFEESEQIPPIEFSVVELDLRRKALENKYQILGNATVADQGKLKLEGEMIGDPLTSSDWSADLTIDSENIEINRFLAADMISKLNELQSEIQLVDFDQAQLNSVVNIGWQKARLTKLNGNLFLQSGDSIKSDFSLAKTTEGLWKLNFPKLLVVKSDHPWQPFSLDLFLAEKFSKEKPEFDLFVNHLRLEDLLQLLPPATVQNLQNFYLKGELNNTHLHYSQDDLQNPFQLEGDFFDLKTDAYKKVPGVNNLSGSFKASQDQVSINIDSSDLIINSFVGEDSFDQQIRLDRFTGKVDWEKNPQGWGISIAEISLLNPDLEFQLTGSVNKIDSQTPLFDLRGTLFRGKAGKVVRSIPANLLTPKLKGWLDRAIVSGDVTGGSVIFRGALEDFPFKQDQGVFEVRLNVENGILDYNKGWPRIDDIFAEVAFIGKKMIITGNSATISKAKIQKTIVQIPNLATNDRHLLIKGNALGNMSDGLRFLQNSPLKESTGKRVDDLNLVGDLDLDLEIDLPLSQVNKTEVKGVVHLQKNALQLETLELPLSELSGEFHFTQNLWHAKEIKARLFESYVTISFDIDNEKNNRFADIFLQGSANKNYIKNRLHDQVGLRLDQLKVLEAIQGSTLWQAQLSLPLLDKSSATKLQISSNLIGLAIKGPHPLDKTRQQNRSLKITTALTKKPKRHVDFEYDKLLKGKIKFNSSASKQFVSEINLHFGEGDLLEKTEGNFLVKADGYLRELDVTAWDEFIKLYSDQKSYESSQFNQDSFTFNIKVDLLKVAGQQLTKNIVEGISLPESAQIEIKNQHIRGTISIPYQLSQQAIKADFERLFLFSGKDTEIKQNLDLDPTKVPELLVTSKQFKYNDLKFGSLSLQAKPAKNGLEIQMLELATSNVKIDITGSWLKEQNQQRSNFDINLSSTALNPLLSQFGFDANGLEGGQTEATINSEWLGAPTDFSFENSRGGLRLDVKKGRYTEIENRAGRVFGLLSFQTLGRRLALDFNDLFEKGFSFDRITGDFDISRGNAFTQNLNMTGPSASIDVQGRIGLSNKDYDQLITVTPSVSDSLPVASALFGPVGAGVGAALFIAEKVIPQIPDTIDKILEKEYTLTGSWEKPKIAAKVLPVTESINSNSHIPTL